MVLSDLQSDAMLFLSTTKLCNVADTDGQRSWLQIPGHSEHAIPSFKQARNRFEIRLAQRSNREFYEETTTLLISFLLSRFKPEVFFDVGASSGYFSFVAASHLTARPIAHAFEMQPNAVDKIHQRAGEVTLPGEVHGHLAGLSDTHIGLKRVWFARTKMFEEEPAESEYREPWWIRLKFAAQGSRSKRNKLSSAEVLLTSLDHFCAERNLSPGLVKIDVDGYEGKVLRGSHRMLREIQPIILLELHKDKKQRFGLLRADCIATLFAAHYTAFFITDHHDLGRCRIVEATAESPLFARQETDMVLFMPPRLQ